MIEALAQLLTTNFVVYALIAGLCLAFVSGPLGSFIVWRRMSYFGDTLAHSALLGIALGLILDINAQLSILVSCIVFSLLLVALGKNKTISTDNLLGILAHSTLAIGVVVLAFSDSVRVNLEALLFGELLTVSAGDLVWVVATSLLVAALLFRYWNQFLAITVHAELAEVEGINPDKLNLLLVVLMALIIAISMKIVGVLLITSLLIIPPAAARQIAKTPEQMAIKASIIGALSVVAGLIMAFIADTPVGPSIVTVASFFFLVLYFLPVRQRMGSE
ncbi:MAG: iron chelate uptake ABC transporter family permease subunit [Gammaproteobacteria bacterium]|nr:hypothetical protein [Gammaproteobacteria bacterium]MDP6094619.1 iron chelate uptake ABC transporter family permease subunit [Gammaproteobacteria bacterium]HJO10998.1 iron chelate uptake ABC transporter family permease subunit [Gammaproteobacteria bacterium]